MNIINKLDQAEYPNTPPEILEVLATDKYFNVRYKVAQNPNTPPTTLEQLATDKYYPVHWNVSRNPNTPHYIRKYLKIREHLATL
jgi:hypothetical protein